MRCRIVKAEGRKKDSVVLVPQVGRPSTAGQGSEVTSSRSFARTQIREEKLEGGNRWFREHFLAERGQETIDKRRNLMDCFLSGRIHKPAENKGDSKKRSQKRS